MNATFGSITEMTFYITALLRGHKAATKCYEEIVKAALTGTLLGCILFIPVRGGKLDTCSIMILSLTFNLIDLSVFNCPGYLYGHRGH